MYQNKFEPYTTLQSLGFGILPKKTTYIPFVNKCGSSFNNKLFFWGSTTLKLTQKGEFGRFRKVFLNRYTNCVTMMILVHFCQHVWNLIEFALFMFVTVPNFTGFVWNFWHFSNYNDFHFQIIMIFIYIIIIICWKCRMSKWLNPMSMPEPWTSQSISEKLM